jgi:hypothetical protein
MTAHTGRADEAFLKKSREEQKRCQGSRKNRS